MIKFLLRTMICILLIFSLPYSIKILAKENPTSIHFLNTLGKQCILIKDINENVMIDMGGIEDSKNINTYLTNKNITKIKSLILTQYNKDSLETLKSLLEYVSIEKIMLPDYNKDSSEHLELLNVINDYNIPISFVSKGWTYNRGHISLEVKLPFKFEDKSQYNELVILAKVDELNYLIANNTLFSHRKNVYKLGDIRGIDVLYLSLKENISYEKEYLKYLDPKLLILQHINFNDYTTFEKSLSNLYTPTIKISDKGNIKTERVLGTTNTLNIFTDK